MILDHWDRNIAWICLNVIKKAKTNKKNERDSGIIKVIENYLIKQWLYKIGIIDEYLKYNFCYYYKNKSIIFIFEVYNTYKNTLIMLNYFSYEVYNLSHFKYLFLLVFHFITNFCSIFRDCYSCLISVKLLHPWK